MGRGLWTVALGVWAGGLWAGCSGGDGGDEVPQYENGLLVQGDCDYPTAGIDGELFPIVNDTNPSVDLVSIGEYGTVIDNEDDYVAFMSQVGFTTFPLPDFTKFQVGAVWYTTHTCGFSLEETLLYEKSDGARVFSVQFFDGSLNCATGCDDVRQNLVIEAFDKDVEGSVCRKIRPGCPPPPE